MRLVTLRFWLCHVPGLAAASPAVFVATVRRGVSEHV